MCDDVSLLQAARREGGTTDHEAVDCATGRGLGFSALEFGELSGVPGGSRVGFCTCAAIEHEADGGLCAELSAALRPYPGMQHRWIDGTLRHGAAQSAILAAQPMTQSPSSHHVTPDFPGQARLVLPPGTPSGTHLHVLEVLFAFGDEGLVPLLLHRRHGAFSCPPRFGAEDVLML